MNKTKIEWTEWTWNPVVGCQRGCHYCYARKIFQRFHKSNKFTDVRLYPERLEQPLRIKKPSKIFVGSMCDLFAEWTPIEYIKKVMEVVKQCPHHTFQFLTKSPFGYRRIKKYPKNCWLGITVTSNRDWGQAVRLVKVKRDNLKFISIEPILGKIDTSYFSLCDWVILGGLTPKPIHKQQWIKDFLYNNRKLNLPIFMKNNLNWRGKLRQEFPIICRE